MSDSVTPQTAAHQAPLSLGFSRQEHWSGLPFPSLPEWEGSSKAWGYMYGGGGLVTKSCLILATPMARSLPGSSVFGTLQARILEWIAISFSGGSPRPRNRTQVACLSGRFFTHWTMRENDTCIGMADSFSYTVEITRHCKATLLQ